MRGWVFRLIVWSAVMFPVAHLASAGEMDEYPAESGARRCRRPNGTCKEICPGARRRERLRAGRCLSRKAAEQGYAPGQYWLGGIYANGQGVAQDYRPGPGLVPQGRRPGRCQGQVGLGLMHHYGFGVPKDEGQAVALFRIPPTKDMPTARTGSVCMTTASASDRDFRQAVELFRKAADQGYGAAERISVSCIRTDAAFPGISCLARNWYLKAADHGTNDAKQLADLLRRRATTDRADGIDSFPGAAGTPHESAGDRQANWVCRRLGRDRAKCRG